MRILAFFLSGIVLAGPVVAQEATTDKHKSVRDPSEIHHVKEFSGLHGLVGTWKLTTKRGILFEMWFRDSDTMLHSRSIEVVGNDTIPKESVQLDCHSGVITYTSTVPNQNNALPVPFTLVESPGRGYVFENMKHDFPQRITYTLDSDSTLSATIGGMTPAGYRESQFLYRREK